MRLTQALSAAACALLFAPPCLAQMEPFHWLDGATVSITTGATSANVALQKMPTGKVQLRIVSDCSSMMFIRKGAGSGVSATSADLPIAPGEVEVLSVDNRPAAPVAFVAMVSPSASCTVSITPGTGL